jgi:hypothetical protein
MNLQPAMRQFSSTQAKQQFGELLEAAAQGPVAIEKHRKIKAILAAPEHFHPVQGAAVESSADPLLLRRAARAQMALLERDRLIKHQRIAIALLTRPAVERRALMRKALDAVARWQAESLCSRDYIERWQAMLRLPVPELALAMTGDAEGWGAALRQNSPWAGVGA